jgi:hypothetical protein
VKIELSLRLTAKRFLYGSEIDNLVGEFQRLRKKLRIDGERIQREVEDYTELSQMVMQLTKTISDSVEKVRTSSGSTTH